MTSGRTIWTWIAVLVLAAPLSACGLHGKPTVERKVAPSGAPGQAEAGKAAAAPSGAVEPGSVVAPGIVETWGAETQLSAQESGWIAHVAVKEGEAVRPGQLLATLDDTAQRRAVELAGAELAEAEAALARLERGATAEELRQAQADHAAAAARGELARSEAARAALLGEGGAVAVAEVERASAEALARTALAEKAEARLQELRRGARAEDRSAARARAAAARARLRLAEANLARRHIVAPIAGTVLVSRSHSGEFYNTGAGPLFVLGDMTRLQVRLEVDEIDASAVTGGAACALYSDAGARLGAGAVFRIAPRMGRKGLPIESPTARQDVRVREVFVEIPASTGLIPGQRVWGQVSRPAAVAREAARRPPSAG